MHVACMVVSGTSHSVCFGGGLFLSGIWREALLLCLEDFHSPRQLEMAMLAAVAASAMASDPLCLQLAPAAMPVTGCVQWTRSVYEAQHRVYEAQHRDGYVQVAVPQQLYSSSTCTCNVATRHGPKASLPGGSSESG